MQKQKICVSKIVPLLAISALLLASCAPYHAGKKPISYRAKGEASWYGPGFHGRKTANGEKFSQNALTAAHKTLPLGTTVKVTNLENDKSVVVRINDRGPFVKGRIIDLSKGAAKEIGLIGTGTAHVEVVALAAGDESEPTEGEATRGDSPKETAHAKKKISSKRRYKKIFPEDSVADGSEASPQEKPYF